MMFCNHIVRNCLDYKHSSNSCALCTPHFLTLVLCYISIHNISIFFFRVSLALLLLLFLEDSTVTDHI